MTSLDRVRGFKAFLVCKVISVLYLVHKHMQG